MATQAVWRKIYRLGLEKAQILFVFKNEKSPTAYFYCYTACNMTKHL